MQNNFVGDIGDYGKYGLLREICAQPLSLSVNWYRVISKENPKQNDGKYIGYLSDPNRYKKYDPSLYEALHKIVVQEHTREIERIERERLFPAIYFSKVVDKNRADWHREALAQTKGTDVVFLDPDNGLETACMHRKNRAKTLHVKWDELKDYYARGQSVVLYQQQARITTEKLVENIMEFQENHLHSDDVKILLFPKGTRRLYFIFLHKKHKAAFEVICNRMEEKWGQDGFCKRIK